MPKTTGSDSESIADLLVAAYHYNNAADSPLRKIATILRGNMLGATRIKQDFDTAFDILTKEKDQ
jgi:hypothetical protein